MRVTTERRIYARLYTCICVSSSSLPPPPWSSLPLSLRRENYPPALRHVEKICAARLYGRNAIRSKPIVRVVNARTWCKYCTLVRNSKTNNEPRVLVSNKRGGDEEYLHTAFLVILIFARACDQAKMSTQKLARFRLKLALNPLNLSLINWRNWRAITRKWENKWYLRIINNSRKLISRNVIAIITHCIETYRRCNDSLTQLINNEEIKNCNSADISIRPPARKNLTNDATGWIPTEHLRNIF